MKADYLIFTDGACKGNPGKGGWAARIEYQSEDSLVELGGAATRTTNNRMELQAALEALKWIEATRPDGSVELFTDSKYLISGVTSWIKGWRRRGWKTAKGTAVLNQDLWEGLDALNQKLKVSWQYVPGHAGHAGNERVDTLAQQLARGQEPELLAGPLAAEDRSPRPKPAPKSAKKKSTGTKGKAWGYLALVRGDLRLFKSWPPCQSFVSGQSGARFKKVGSETEARALARAWGGDWGALKR